MGVRVFDFQSKFKRQIEILGLCLSGHLQKPLRTFDLADYFHVEELTIKRDLQDLRSYGIDLHSSKKSGVCLTSELPKEKLVEIIIHYVGFNHKDYALDKATSLIVEKKGIDAVSCFVMLQLYIDNSEAVRIDYNKIGSKIEKDKEIEPLLIFQSEVTWRLLAGSEGKLKQYLLDKIAAIKTTGRHFERTKYDYSNQLKYAWKTWFGNEKYSIKLWLSSFWAERVNPRLLAEDQKITRNNDGSVIFECTVNSLNEIAGWVVSRGEGIKVIEPRELKEKVIELANGVLKNYKN
jgi:predicted DNA-binding transcriptional regulator YafY